MPDSCGQYNPEGCTESCQQCYEGVIAGVKEYACYGQCVVVDAYGMKHLGPGLGAPAGWTPSAGGSMAEMIADEIANINNSEPTPPTNFVDPLLSCNGDCGTLCGPFDNCYWRSDVLGNCIESRCFGPKFPRPDAKPPWKFKAKGRKVGPRDLTEVDRLTQTTVEEQKAALAAARLNFNKRGGGGGIPGPFKYRPKLFTQDQANKFCKCNTADGCGIEAGACGGKCWWMDHLDVTKDDPNPVPLPNQEIQWKCAANNPGPWSPDGDPLREIETEQVLKVALAKARRAANFDGTMQAAKDCCNGGPCDTTKNQCYYNTDGKRACVCHPKMVGGIAMPPLPAADGWFPFVPPPPTAQFQTPPAPLNCCRGDKCLSGYQCWRYGKNNNQCQCVLILNAPPLPKPWEVFKDQITPMY